MLEQVLEVYTMRRKDREVTDDCEIDAIIASCNCCRLGFYDQGSVYIVPLNFGYEKKSGKRIFYFHSAKQGKKIQLIETCPQVGFELDTGYQLQKGADACQYSARFQSVIGNGTASIIHNHAEKHHALQSIMYQNTHKNNWEFHDEMIDTVCVFKIEVTALSCKEHK